METSQASNQANSPKKLGRYQILNEVGRGATAFVYRAYDPQLDRYLAIKVLREELAKDVDYRDAFIKEARLAAQLTHPGIVTIFDVGIADNKPYIGMELLEGATLEQVLAAQGKLNLRTVLAIAAQLSKALNYAHKQGVVHRDIKPGNIVVLKDKKTVKLTDFGIAQLDESLGSAGKGSDKVLGTPEYMAPEQVLGKTLDSRADIYSFGVLLYRMLMGNPPFKSDDLGKLFSQIVKSKPPPIQLTEEKLQDDVQDFIRKLLQKKPEKRFNSAAEVGVELAKLQSRIAGEKNLKEKNFVSLRLRWTATMAGVVFFSMCISLLIVYFVQTWALSGITFDYGRSIAQMLSFESSEPILLDDQVGLNAIIREASKNEQLTSVSVMDTSDQVLASSDAALIGSTFNPPQQRELEQAREDIRIYLRQGTGKQVLYDVELPISYSGKNIGKLYVTFNADSMYAASKTTLITMLVVMMITLVVVFIITLSLARQTSKDFQRVTAAVNKLSSGRFDARLLSDRNDETGQLFDAFNLLAKSVETKLEPQKHATESSVDPVAVGTAANLQEVELENTLKLEIQSPKK